MRDKRFMVLAIRNDDESVGEEFQGGWSTAGPGLIKCIENVSIPAKFFESHERAQGHQMIFDPRMGEGYKAKKRTGVGWC